MASSSPTLPIAALRTNVRFHVAAYPNSMATELLYADKEADSPGNGVTTGLHFLFSLGFVCSVRLTNEPLLTERAEW